MSDILVTPTTYHQLYNESNNYYIMDTDSISQFDRMLEKQEELITSSVTDTTNQAVTDSTGDISDAETILAYSTGNVAPADTNIYTNTMSTTISSTNNLSPSCMSYDTHGGTSPTYSTAKTSPSSHGALNYAGTQCSPLSEPRTPLSPHSGTTSDASTSLLPGSPFSPTSSIQALIEASAMLSEKEYDTNSNASNTSSNTSNISNISTEVSQEAAFQKQSEKSSDKTPWLAILPPCRICGDKASGFHYGVNTCEACKGFFRRTITKHTVYTCKRNAIECGLRGGKRKTCSSCRWKKCLEVGMSKDAIRTGRYTHLTRTSYIKEMNKLEGKIDSVILHGRESEDERVNSKSPLSITAVPSYVKQSNEHLDRLIDTFVRKVLALCPEGSNAFGERTEEEEQKQIEYMQEIERKTELFGSLDPISLDEYRQIYEMTGLEVDDRQQLLNHWGKVVEIVVQKTVQFAKQIPGFVDLSIKDQCSLVKVGGYEVKFLCGYHRINIDLQCCYCPLADKVFHKSEMKKIGDTEYVEILFKYARKFQAMHLTRTERMLLAAIAITSSDRCLLENQSEADKIQSKLVIALEYHIKQTHPRDDGRLARILTSLMTLRELAYAHEKVLGAVLTTDWPNVQFPPLVYELIFT